MKLTEADEADDVYDTHPTHHFVVRTIVVMCGWCC